MATPTPILTIGSCLRDIFCYTKDGYLIASKQLLCDEVFGFEVGSKTNAHSVVQACGGSAANTAVAFARFGFTVSVMTSIGADAFGDKCLADLKDEGVKLQHVTRSKKNTTGVSLVINHLGTHKHFIIAYRGASENLIVSAAKLGAAMPKAVYLSALHGNYAGANMQSIASLIQKRGVPLFWNPGGKELSRPGFIRRFAPLAKALFLNKDETYELVMPHSKKRIFALTRLCRMLHAFGPGIAVVTDGHRGASAYDGKKLYYQRAILGKTVNKTGAGDAFGAAFVAGLFLFKNDIRRSLRLATENAHAVVGAVGAQTGILHKSDIRKLTL